MEREGDIVIRVTITRGATIKVSISKIDRCTQRIDKIGEKVLSGGLKNPNPRHEVTSVVIHIYFLALQELCFTLAYLLFFICLALEKRKKLLYYIS
jgi:hypothetical protein